MRRMSKIGVIGAGNVGAAIVNALVLRNIGREVVLFNRRRERAVAEAMDIDDSIPLLSEMQVTATNRYEDLSECRVIAVPIGARQKEGETRIQLLERNAEIIRGVIRELDRTAPEAIIIMVSNPVDILTRVAQEASVREHRRIFGSGTVLDTYQIGKKLRVNRKNVHIHVVGGARRQQICGLVECDHRLGSAR